MTKRKRLLGIVSLFLMLTLAMIMTACGSKTEAEPEAEEPQQEVAEEEAEPEVEVVKVIEEIDTEDMVEVPLQIESITLFEDGSLRIVPTEDLLKNAETNILFSHGAIISNKKLIASLGNDATLLLGERYSEHLYFKGKGETEGGWFFSTVRNLQNCANLSKYKQKKALCNY